MGVNEKVQSCHVVKILSGNFTRRSGSGGLVIVKKGNILAGNDVSMADERGALGSDNIRMDTVRKII